MDVRFQENKVLVRTLHPGLRKVVAIDVFRAGRLLRSNANRQMIASSLLFDRRSVVRGRQMLMRQQRQPLASKVFPVLRRVRPYQMLKRQPCLVELVLHRQALVQSMVVGR
ncbi:hypothetical protein CIG75_06275 [Tumebacillus algifaecis]|uniref:Uncharacterized protein n=1 Tax=Tumebacillus algifaecis TaxID=1214604 RepID=A0A223CZ48_9BACL|nr:hypothetical protein CIG75_06275 [Tumebacillus algifaecis]